jgi:hypothetical protein
VDGRARQHRLAANLPEMDNLEWPFRAAEALDARALTFRELRRFHAAIYPGVWAPRGVDLTAVDRARAAWLWSGRSAVLAGLSAAAIHGAKWIEPDAPAQLVHTNRRPPRLIDVHTDRLSDGESQLINGLPVTTPARTAFDLGRRSNRLAGVQRIDALMNATNLKVSEIEAVIPVHRGVRGLRRLRRSLELVDGGAESPQETRLRLILMDDEIPKPETQIEFYDDYGEVMIRVDMGWREWKVAVEYDGVQHWADGRQRSWDIERIEILEALGWTVIRVSAAMLRKPEVITERVRDKLRKAGCLLV